MYLMYVDESGDSGLVNSNTRYFALSGVIIHELRWRDYLNELIAFRMRLKDSFGLKLREEFHASRFITRPGPELTRIKRHDRLAMIRAFADQLASMKDFNVISIVVDKLEKPQGYDVFTTAWKALIQRFENTISRHNFPGPADRDDRGLVLADHTDANKLMALMRQMRHYNPVRHQTPVYGEGYRNLPIVYIVEDPLFRDSQHSYFIQGADLAAFLLYQYKAPCAYMKAKGGGNYLMRLKPVLCYHASPTNNLGIVEL